MKSAKDDLLVHAHFYLLAAALVVAALTWAFMPKPATASNSPDYLCYMPASMQPVIYMQNQTPAKLEAAPQLA